MPYTVNAAPFTIFTFQHVQLPSLACGGGNSRWLRLCTPLASAQGLHYQRSSLTQPKPTAVPFMQARNSVPRIPQNSTQKFLMNNQLNLDILQFEAYQQNTPQTHAQFLTHFTQMHSIQTLEVAMFQRMGRLPFTILLEAENPTATQPCAMAPNFMSRNLPSLAF